MVVVKNVCVVDPALEDMNRKVVKAAGDLEKFEENQGGGIREDVS